MAIKVIKEAYDSVRDNIGGKLTVAKQIAEGVKNTLIRNEDVELFAADRMQICMECEHKNAVTCGKCGCVLEIKTRSMRASCPVGKWTSVLD